MKHLEPIQEHQNAPKELKKTELYIRDLNCHFQTLCQELEERVKVLESILQDEIDSRKK